MRFARLSILPSFLRSLVAGVALGGVYLAVAYLGIARWDVETALLWPASGLYIGALLACDRRLWPSLALGALIGSLGANMLAGNSAAVSLAFAVPTCAEGLLGAVLVLRLADDRFTLERVRDVAALVGGAAVVSNGLTALSAAAAAVQAYDASFGESWLRWWSADALGIVAVAPLVVLALRTRPSRPSRERLCQETLPFVLLAAAVIFFSMTDPPEAAAIVAGAVGFPILLWAGWRCSIRAAALITPALAIGVTYIASRDVEALGLGSVSSTDTIVVQAFLATLLVGSLTVAAAAAERRRTERNLGQTRDRLERLIGAAPVAYVSLADDQRITEWNAGARATFGWERSEALGRLLHETIIPQGQGEAWRDRLETGAAHDGATQALLARHRSGRDMTVELTTAAAAQGEGLQLFMADVSERERARAQLMEANGLLERRQEELNEAVQRVEQLGEELGHKALQIERADHEQARLRTEFEQAGAQRDEALRQLEEARQAAAWARAATAEAREATAAREAELETLQQESEAVRKQLHELRDEHARSRAKLDEAENEAAAVRVELEQTAERFAAERERLERALGEREERFSEVDQERLLLARRATDLIARYDARGTCLYASPACRELLGLEPEELVGAQGADLLHPDDRPLLNRARAAEGDSRFRARLRRKDGSLTEVKATFSPIRDRASGRLLEIEATVRRAPAEREVELQERPALAGPRPLGEVQLSHPPEVLSS